MISEFWLNSDQNSEIITGVRADRARSQHPRFGRDGAAPVS